MNKPGKRFIAGAVCPQCQEMDRIVMYREDNDEYRECVSCGFKEKQVFKQHQRELDTRVNQTEESVRAETQVLNFPPINNADKK
ncbi:hypothetical protein TDB9533_03261 [Thalassocella blandensis]|nr:hypothetical protein TDB9533_03261 [Thalassocella blandensis]